MAATQALAAKRREIGSIFYSVRLYVATYKQKYTARWWLLLYQNLCYLYP